jgi:AAA+ superfamily predicted ATPase
VIIAATNHPDVLDYALFRRFDDMVQYDLPNQEQTVAVLKARLAGFHAKRFVWSKIAEHATGLSHAEISRAADEAIKDSIIHDRDTVAEADLVRMLEERKLISGKLASSDDNVP